MRKYSSTGRAVLDASARPPAQPGYAWVKEIGRGGYGVVHLFRKLRPGKDGEKFVAGKIVHRDAFGEAGDRSAEAGYARAFAGLQNFLKLTSGSPSLLTLLDVNQRHEQGYFCYVMELADDVEAGLTIHPVTYRPKTLRSVLRRDGQRRRLPVEQCVNLGLQLAEGLEVLHGAGFVHRDLRPANIIFVNGVAKLADIDLVAENLADLPSYIPRSYAAPEGAHSSHADIYSLGITLYEMCTGLPPEAFPCLPRDLRHWPDHSRMLKLNRVVLKACARKPNDRHASAGELLAELAEAIPTSDTTSIS